MILHKTREWLTKTHSFADLVGVGIHTVIVSLNSLELRDSIPYANQLMEWSRSGFYVQAGFLYSEHWKNPDAWGLVTQLMMEYDNMVGYSGIIDPEDFVLAVHGVISLDTFWEPFKHRICFWSMDMVDLRNKVLIGAKAIELGRDPDAEYERFVKAGGKYFLEYPELCL